MKRIFTYLTALLCLSIFFYSCEPENDNGDNGDNTEDPNGKPDDQSDDKEPIKVHGCPDGNHPHAMDLGLPSGTKWACCNVGASSPEDYGGYYAWGEVEEKDDYDTDNYFYYNTDTEEYVNLGSDSVKISYDVAHVLMGGSWQMPSNAQIDELVSCCTHTWTQKNGVNGILVTGPNGGQVFFPAAGYRWSDEFDDAGTYGCYWSGSLIPGYNSNAYAFYFASDAWSRVSVIRYPGRSVRAVCP